VLKTNTDEQGCALQHSVQPYVAFALPLLVVTIVGVVASAKSGQWASLWYLAAVWSFFLPWSFLLSRYQITWNQGEITQRAAGGRDVTIDIEDITRVKLEASDAATLLSFRRPFRRISIYSSDGKFIDVSLKHFVAQDIRRLMRFIHEQRADLTLPKNWL
jgi:hypothetical protein